MPFKTNRAAKPVPRLSGFSLLGFTGPDAGPFLQAQTMNDVRGLSIDQWQWNGWLNAKGRVIALFALLKLADDEFVAVLPDFPSQQLQPLLQRFVFRSKLKIQPITELVAAADFDGIDQGVASDQATGNKQDGLSLDFSGSEARRCLVLLPEGHADLLPPDLDCDGRWLAVDLAHGLPRLASSQVESWTPQMLSLERLRAYSLKKGCYPGQEIVARTHYLGQARRALSRVAGAGLELGGTLKDDQGVAFGSVISVAPASASGLAVVQSEKRVFDAWIGDQPITLPAFLDGLQRPV